MSYSEETKRRARELWSAGLGATAIARALGEETGREPGTTTIKRWCLPEYLREDLARKQTPAYREQQRVYNNHRSPVWNSSGGSRHSKPKRVHYCGCDYKVAAPRLREGDPMTCIHCSHEIERSAVASA